MTAFRYVRDVALASLIIGASACSMAQTQTQSGTTFEPTVGQAGKDVVWVPTPQALVNKMLDMAKVTPNDTVYDLGSGDGRTVITAAEARRARVRHRVQPRHGGALQAERREGRRDREGELPAGGSLQDRFLAGDGDHHVSAS
jgi:hypothetical protein